MSELDRHWIRSRGFIWSTFGICVACAIFGVVLVGLTALVPGQGGPPTFAYVVVPLVFTLVGLIQALIIWSIDHGIRDRKYRPRC